jgi:7-cyano-7-deazaguanine synthase in queuosine biosynthesis
MENDVIFENIKQGKDHVVVWSGGCDSTLLLNLVAENFGTYEKPVKAISIHHHLIGDMKNRKETESREKILSELKSRGLHIVHNVIEIKSEMDYMYGKGGGLPQAFVWALNILTYVAHGSNVYFGYIRHDDFWHLRQYFEEMIEAGCKLLGKEIKLHFPLEYCSKEYIIADLAVRKLYDLVWWCEIPTEKGEKCGECIPCKTHSTALVKLAMEGCEWAYDKIPNQLKVVKKNIKKNK